MFTNGLNLFAAQTRTTATRFKGDGEMVDVIDLYLLNLVVTVGMFVVLVFRAWVELKHYKTIWKEAEWRRTYETVGRILKAEKDLFKGVEGGDELYKLLTQMFNAEEKAS